ncbi:ABC transporter permease [Bryobacter aggregatus]|uniref:ABC transporter permease n=1 Tax=Bryobacter aggregatus TaxID=360054 RepID=UPI0004E1F6EB|nr:ABC transporter permease [Bryobacter aggregatus]
MTRTIVALSLEHLVLVFAAVSLACLVAIPLAVWCFRHRSPGSLVLRLADIIQTVPSLALFGLLIPFAGLGPKLAIFALFLYALLPILRSTVVGLEGVPVDVLEAATSLGMTASERLREVELPLAAPSILSGLRIATVTTIGTATVAAAIGAGGLGVLLYRGLATVETSLLIAGAAPAALMAIAADLGFQWIEGKYSYSRRSH